MKYFYFAVTIEENGKYYSYVVKVSPSDNVLCKLNIKGILYANACHTKKQAAATVEYWNRQHKNNGKYLFDNPAF